MRIVLDIEAAHTIDEIEALHAETERVVNAVIYLGEDYWVRDQHGSIVGEWEIGGL